MATQGIEAGSGDKTWSGLISLPVAERETAMRQRYEKLLALPEDQLESVLRDMITAEYALDPTSLHAFTASRLRALLSIASTDIERARRLARAGDVVFNRMPGAIAMRRTEIVQTIARTELSASEVELLRELLPTLLQQLPRLATKPFEERADYVQAGGDGAGKPWWKFW